MRLWEQGTRTLLTSLERGQTACPIENQRLLASPSERFHQWQVIKITLWACIAEVLPKSHNLSSSHEMFHCKYQPMVNHPTSNNPAPSLHSWKISRTDSFIICPPLLLPSWDIAVSP